MGQLLVWIVARGLSELPPTHCPPPGVHMDARVQKVGVTGPLIP